MLDAVIFDLDGTLLDWSGFKGDWDTLHRNYWKSAYTYLSDNLGSLPDLDPFAKDIRRRLFDAWETNTNGSLDAPHIVDILRDALTELGLDSSAIDMEIVLDRYGWGRAPGIDLYPGVTSLLDELRHAGLRVGLLTNAMMPMRIRDRELRDLDIIDRFDCRVSACEVGKLKPHPLPFEHTLGCLGVSAASTVFVGDSLRYDITGANGMGMRSVWHKIEEEEQLSDAWIPDATIETPQDLLPILDDWFPRWRN